MELGGCHAFSSRESHRILASLKGIEVDLPAEGVREDLSDFEVDVYLSFEDLLEIDFLSQFVDSHIFFLVEFVFGVLDFNRNERLLLKQLILCFDFHHTLVSTRE